LLNFNNKSLGCAPSFWSATQDAAKKQRVNISIGVEMFIIFGGATSGFV